MKVNSRRLVGTIFKLGKDTKGDKRAKVIADRFYDALALVGSDAKA